MFSTLPKIDFSLRTGSLFFCMLMLSILANLVECCLLLMVLDSVGQDRTVWNVKTDPKYMYIFLNLDSVDQDQTVLKMKTDLKYIFMPLH